MKIVSRTHQGLVRLNNEDCVWFDAELGIAVLADGMGGLLAGEEASHVATYEAQLQLEANVELDEWIYAYPFESPPFENGSQKKT